MVKIIFVVTCLIAAFGESSTSTNIKCGFYSNAYFNIVGSIYRCEVNNNPNILTKESAQISGISGAHQSSKSNDDVLGISAYSKAMQVFPKGLEKYFKNIKMISISSCQLKEIHQSDLKVFPDLVYFYLWNNQIEVIEEGLFDFNTKLEVVGIYESNVIHIDPNVFDHLSNLSFFWFSSVPCIDQRIDDSKEKVQQLIKDKIKSKCANSDFLSLETQIKTLESESKTLNSAAFITKLEALENRFNASKFSKFRPLNYQFQNLKSIASSTQAPVLSLIATNDLKKVTDKSEDCKSAQCPAESLNITHNAIQTTLNEIKSIVTVHDSNSAQLQVCQSNLTSAQLAMTKSIDKQSVSFADLVTKVNDVQDIQKTQNTLINDIKSELTALKTDIDTKITDLKADIKTDMDTKIDEKLEFFEDSLTNSEARNGRKIDEVKKELDQVRYKLSVSIDAKLKAVERRMTEKIDKILNALKIDE